jgi:hypothetical protein
VYTSASAGPIDMNQELCDPVEKEFSSDWQQIMDATIVSLLQHCESQMLKVCSDLGKSIASALVSAGMTSDRVTSLVTAANRNCTTLIKASIQSMKDTATNSQRDLNRSLLPMIQNRMCSGYTATVRVPSGSGKFDRMKSALTMHTQVSLESMFSESTKEMLKAIGKMVELLAGMLSKVSVDMTLAMERVYSVCWDQQTDQTTGVVVDPTQLAKIRQCRNRVLPDLQKLVSISNTTMGLLGIEREELDLDIMGVESWDDQYQKKYQQAKESGNVIEILDSDSEDEVENARNRKMPAKPPASLPAAMRVKSESSP